jgi:putative (di)nucleoside polyphosphate hydrolase
VSHAFELSLVALLVGVLLINASGLIGVRQRASDCPWIDSPDTWQMPQAPLASGEPVRDAALRLLQHDTGIEDVTLLAEAPGWFSFELPANLIGVALQGRYVGQKFKWVAARLAGEPPGRCASPQHPPAFTLWRWVTPAEAVALAPPLKREVYGDVLSVFAPILADASKAHRASTRIASAPWFVNLPR